MARRLRGWRIMALAFAERVTVGASVGIRESRKASRSLKLQSSDKLGRLLTLTYTATLCAKPCFLQHRNIAQETMAVIHARLPKPWHE